MHISEVHAYQREKEEKMRNGYDSKIDSPADKQTKSFVEHDGNYDNNVLGLRVKIPESNDNIPRVDSLEDPEKKDKSRIV